MKITLQKVRFKNFLSYGNSFTEIDLNKPGTTLIKGFNGAGKSTFVDSICFALFGKPYRKANKPTLINSINNKDMVVEIEFVIGSKQYKIVRGLKPTLFELYVDGVLSTQTASSKDYQYYLEENVLKINYRSFTQIVVLGSSLYVPFMELPAAYRREIIEDLLDIKMFSNMNVILKQRMIQNKTNLAEFENKKKSLEKEIDLIKTHISAISNITSVEKLEEEKKDKIKEIDELLLLNKNIKEETKKLEKYSDELVQTLNVKLNKYKSSVQTIENNLKANQKQLDFYNHSDECPTCKQNINEEFKTKTVNELMDEIKTRKKQLSTINVKIDEMNKLIIIANEKNKKFNSYSKDIENNLSKIEYIENIVKSIDSKIKEQTDKTASYIEKENIKLKEFVDNLSLIEKDEKISLRDKELMNVCSVLLKDDGIKTNIIKQYIPIINSSINKFLGDMDFFVNFEIDENFNEIIKSRYRDEYSYANFSEGEKQRINLALVFAWREIAKLKSSIDINILIMDEMFDSSLDEEGLECLSKIINRNDNNSNVFIISHRNGVEDKFNNVLRIKKSGNFSRISND